MKTIIAGSRDGVEYEDVVKAMESCPWTPTEIVSGKARGSDTFGEQWANDNNIPIKEFPANWDRYGKRAGYIRNTDMANYADALVAVWDGKSKGTLHMINIASEKSLIIHIHTINKYTYDLQS
jgi:hypothetical protein